MDTDIELIRKWAAENKHPIFMGEFGSVVLLEIKQNMTPGRKIMPKIFTAFIFAALPMLSLIHAQTHSGLSYGPNTANLLDIYMPTGGSAPYPVVVWIHGGGWSMGSRTDGEEAQLSSMLGSRGYAIVSIGYRFSDVAQWPAQIHDVKGAIRWIRANASTYNFNTNCISVVGMSAGGHLAAFVGTAGGVGTYTVDTITMDLEGSVGGNAQQSSRVNAVVDLYGPIDFLTLNNNCPQNNPAVSFMDHNAPDSPVSNLMGAAIQSIPDRCKLVNPITLVSADDPPFLMLHGNLDVLVPICQSFLLNDALQQAYAANGKEAKLYKLPTEGHGFSVTVMRDTVINFLTRNACATGTRIKGTGNGAQKNSVADIAIRNSLLWVTADGPFELTVSDMRGRPLLLKRFPASSTAQSVGIRGMDAGVIVCAVHAANGTRTVLMLNALED